MTHCQPSWHVTAPIPSKSTNAGIVTTPNLAINSWPLDPIESSWVIAVHGMLEKYCSVFALVLHRETRTTSKGLRSGPNFFRFL
jgi:hypothetical protein